MRWLTYFILAYVALGLQVGLGNYVAYRGVKPDFVLMAVIFIAINAPRDAALLGCFGMGLMQDLLTHHPPGLFALAYGLVGLMAAGIQQVVYREHPLTHFAVALAGGVVVAAVVLLNGWLHPPGPGVSVWVGSAGPAPATQATLHPVRGSPATELARALYTAVLAPAVMWLLARARRSFAFQPPRRRLANRF